ncbi:phosphoribosylformylglycinamidine cyclo-ligase [Candidatus Nomurabacteria bacterium RIFOXYC2_FULL_36_8]|nr:MAG: Phosphoribosylformylglycinamidine cyclo-ligase [Candidatus Nomurabacteria bacterium GW2011_GWE2_36_115]KKP94358.1 MAG: Phosphoribosylformylglycinamidine cyclo-ligase [Candidatus Nomurabacteria bacterium GW2011_GWF2_36_126]KKP96816.1 MAG: Phosphoribosylformylglycinamidine cyclo-ligase [Candidatus Nomurabacteria bacterium GW2011_GWD2_36_14]KKP99580.1 MAG: Phosphoribosylformylglycinamidine cyclo-ligase [Candidatus Nomurabacteria bacterium GW2011_GWF2_36_19]KKQ05576.1 MAG: Phosphoribosylfor
MADLYKDAGVNIDAGNEVVRRIKADVASTHTSAVLTGIGSFGGLYDIGEVLKSYKNPVLVQSIDGVGTKLSVARMMGKYDSVGEDIVNHCCDDLLAMGARSLTFLDYVAHDKLDPAVMEAMVSGMSKACRENGVSLLGGETAEMPGTYREGEHDIAGCITGVVEKDKIVTGEKIKEGDIILGFASSGLHTNGFSLARKVLFDIGEYKVDTKVDELGETVGESLLKVHVNYSKPVLEMLDAGVDIHGIAHITGGGFIENIPRVLPRDVDAEITLNSWPILPIFSLMQKIGKIEDEEMYRAFNMGIGLMLIIPSEEKEKIIEILKKYQKFSFFEVGKIINGNKKVVLK